MRQNFIQYLIQIKQYPAALIAIEKTIQLGELKKRFDLIVYKNNTPWILIECKEANVSISEKTLEQILQYQQVVEASYLVMTNGHSTYGAKIETGKQFNLCSNCKSSAGECITFKIDGFSRISKTGLKSISEKGSNK